MQASGTCVRTLVAMTLALAGSACQLGGGVPTTTEPDGARDAEADRAAIHAVYRAYSARLAADDPRGAAALIDRETLAFYETVRHDALALSAAALRARPPHEQVTIIMFRQGKTRASLQTQPIAELVAASITPIIDPARTRLYEVVVNGERATGQVGLDGATLRELARLGGGAMPSLGLVGRVPFEFRRDPEGWRLNFVAATRMAADSLIDGDPIEEVTASLAKHHGVDVETLYAPPP